MALQLGQGAAWLVAKPIREPPLPALMAKNGATERGLLAASKALGWTIQGGAQSVTPGASAPPRQHVRGQRTRGAHLGRLHCTSGLVPQGRASGPSRFCRQLTPGHWGRRGARRSLHSKPGPRALCSGRTWQDGSGAAHLGQQGRAALSTLRRTRAWLGCPSSLHPHLPAPASPGDSDRQFPGGQPPPSGSAAAEPRARPPPVTPCRGAF